LTRVSVILLVAFALLLPTWSTEGAAKGTRHASSTSLFAWGAGGHGQLGTGELYVKGCSCVARPHHVALSRVVAVASGYRFSVALRSDGTVWTWGANDYGQLGRGFISKKGCRCTRVAAKVKGLSQVVAISAASSFVLTLERNGTVWAWGTNSFGELGTGVNPFGEKGCICKDHPIRIRGLPQATAVSAGTGQFGLALDRLGHVWSWGENMTGQLGLHITNTENCLCQPGPTEVEGLPKVRQVSAGGGFAVALDTAGGEWAWGVNDQSQLARPAITSGICACIDYPVRVHGLPHAISVSAGIAFALTLTTGGHMWGWGADYEGDLAAGPTHGLVARPVRGAWSHRFRQITSGGATGMGITRAGELFAWGRDTTGQFGRGVVLTRGCGCSKRPVRVMAGVRRVSVGPGFVLTLR
jgi:alpha-tubulin suppressor-like RCC1 family protein